MPARRLTHVPILFIPGDILLSPRLARQFRSRNSRGGRKPQESPTATGAVIWSCLREWRSEIAAVRMRRDAHVRSCSLPNRRGRAILEDERLGPQVTASGKGPVRSPAASAHTVRPRNSVCLCSRFPDLAVASATPIIGTTSEHNLCPRRHPANDATVSWRRVSSRRARSSDHDDDDDDDDFAKVASDLLITLTCINRANFLPDVSRVEIPSLRFVRDLRLKFTFALKGSRANTATMVKATIRVYVRKECPVEEVDNGLTCIVMMQIVKRRFYDGREHRRQQRRCVVPSGRDV